MNNQENPNWDKWMALGKWNITEAVLLSLNLNPDFTKDLWNWGREPSTRDQYGQNPWQKLSKNSDHAKSLFSQYKDRLLIIERLTSEERKEFGIFSGGFQEQVKRIEFCAFASSKFLDGVPHAFIDCVDASSTKTPTPRKGSIDELSPKTKSKYLELIGGLVLAYHGDEFSVKNGRATIKPIMDELERVGIKCDSSFLSDTLKQAWEKIDMQAIKKTD